LAKRNNLRGERNILPRKSNKYLGPNGSVAAETSHHSFLAYLYRGCALAWATSNVQNTCYDDRRCGKNQAASDAWAILRVWTRTHIPQRGWKDQIKGFEMPSRAARSIGHSAHPASASDDCAEIIAATAPSTAVRVGRHSVDGAPTRAFCVRG
jgi:hypothetical protein